MRFYSRVEIAFTHRASSRPASSHENNTGLLPVSIVYIVRTSNGSETPSASSPFLGPPGARLSAFLRSRCARTQGWSEFACCAGRIQKVPVCRSLSAFLRSRCARTQGWSEFACCAGRIQNVWICHSLSAFVRSHCARTQGWSEFACGAGRIQKVPVCHSLSVFLRSPYARTHGGPARISISVQFVHRGCFLFVAAPPTVNSQSVTYINI